jgi:hypothetical protein
LGELASVYRERLSGNYLLELWEQHLEELTILWDNDETDHLHL